MALPIVAGRRRRGKDDNEQRSRYSSDLLARIRTRRGTLAVVGVAVISRSCD